MSDAHRHPPVALRVGDIRVDAADAPEPTLGPAPDERPMAVTPDRSSGWFGRALNRVLDSWHMLPTEPWW